MTEYPECEKLAKVSDSVRDIREFIDWLNYNKKIFLMEFGIIDNIINPGHTYEGYISARKSINELVMEFFEIDQIKLDQERQVMFDSLKKD